MAAPRQAPLRPSERRRKRGSSPRTPRRRPKTSLPARQGGERGIRSEVSFRRLRKPWRSVGRWAAAKMTEQDAQNNQKPCSNSSRSRSSCQSKRGLLAVSLVCDASVARGVVHRCIYLALCGHVQFSVVGLVLNENNISYAVYLDLLSTYV